MKVNSVNLNNKRSFALPIPIEVQKQIKRITLVALPFFGQTNTFHRPILIGLSVRRLWNAAEELYEADAEKRCCQVFQTAFATLDVVGKIFFPGNLLIKLILMPRLIFKETKTLIACIEKKKSSSPGKALYAFLDMP